ncbi:50S ribosomal protein L35 [Paenibacillus mesotrionivorans]|uniref:50S ribosomal protein L35 n=1 Tax=Paenibacillus mesotrionivorans TaxID=3160968 RepID=A0ACC7NVD2_9BACL
MPKMKTHRGAAKRFTKTGTGKIKRNKSGKRHILEHKSSKQKARLGKSAIMTKGDTKRIESLLVYVK